MLFLILLFQTVMATPMQADPSVITPLAHLLALFDWMVMALLAHTLLLVGLTIFHRLSAKEFTLHSLVQSLHCIHSLSRQLWEVTPLSTVYTHHHPHPHLHPLHLLLATLGEPGQESGLAIREEYLGNQDAEEADQVLQSQVPYQQWDSNRLTSQQALAMSTRLASPHAPHWLLMSIDIQPGKEMWLLLRELSLKIALFQGRTLFALLDFHKFICKNCHSPYIFYI